MSSYRGHLRGGVFFFGLAWLGLWGIYRSGLVGDAFVEAFRGWRVLPLLAVSLVMALWPDVDITSKAQKFFYRVLIGVDIGLLLGKRYQEAAVLGLLAMVPIVSRHRGWTHTIWAAILVPAPLLLLPMYLEGKVIWAGLPYYLAGLVGYVSHLILDRKFL
ncbi:MAG: hypothetical protein DRP95_03435 [Candidatus Latescibacterota bacterium]|nr:MAG: hypothetical protein DRP95_03435 [Candidatus Latescibacterota bacterium]